VQIVGDENATVYTMGRGMYQKIFCKTCGVPVQNRVTTLPEEKLAEMSAIALEWYNRGHTNRSINSRIIDGINLDELRKSKGFTRIDGWANIPPLYENP
jgi:hypothetical protein